MNIKNYIRNLVVEFSIYTIVLCLLDRYNLKFIIKLDEYTSIILEYQLLIIFLICLLLVLIFRKYWKFNILLIIRYFVPAILLINLSIYYDKSLIFVLSILIIYVLLHPLLFVLKRMVLKCYSYIFSKSYKIRKKLYLLVIRKFYVNRKKYKSKTQTFISKDEPIERENEDLLGRKNFISILTECLNNIEWKKSATILLSAKWGEGKTSCINLLKNRFNIKFKYLKKSLIEEKFCFIDINPWFNDTKEKLLNAIFGEINHFAKTNAPYKSFEGEFDDIIKLSNVKLGNIELALDKFTDDKNIQHKIENIGKFLKEEYQKRIIIVLDDIDRLNKKNILFIMQIVEMFKQYTNIIFILSCNYDKVRQILCEVSDPCVQKDNQIDIVRKTVYYEDFLNKIITNPIDMPKIEYYFITEELVKQLNIILRENSIYKEDLKYIATKVFQTIRDIKRFYNYFITIFELFDKRLDIYNLINISILNVFFPELYKDAYVNKSQWFDIEFWKESIFGKEKNNNSTEILKENINNYFKNLINKYDDTKQNILKELLFLVSSTYNFANKAMNFNKIASSTETSYFREKSFLSAYFIQYNFSIILNNKIKEWYKINE